MVKVITERPARTVGENESATGVDDGSNGTDWEPDATTGIPPGNDPGDVLTWDGDSWEPEAPVGVADQWKQPVRAATTGNITISTALNSGDTLDGVTLATGDRVLVKDQSSAAQNGIYIVGASPSRASDLDADDEVLGAVVYVVEGTANVSTIWRVTNTAATIVGTDAINWSAFGSHGLVVISPSQLTSNTDNWNPTGLAAAEVIRAYTDASRNLTGITAPSPVVSRTLVLANVGGFDLVLKHDTTSTSTNRFYCPNDADATLQQDSAAWLVYDVTSTRWRVVAMAGGSGGGSGSITSSGYTMSTARLLGRTTASTGAIEEITVGTGLTLSAGSLTATGGSGGGRGEYASKYNPDHETPTTTPSIVAEFNGALDSGWAWNSTPSTADYTSMPGYGLFKLTGTPDHSLYKAWSPGSVDITAACKLHVSLVSNATSNLTVLFGPGDSTSMVPNNAVLVGGFYRGAAGTTTQDFYTRDSAAFNQRQEITPTRFHGGTFTIYLRITRTISSNTWTAYISDNGITWEQFSTTHVKSMTVASLFLRISDNPGIVAVDWIRGWDSLVEHVGA